MTDFETHPAGTAARIAELEAGRVNPESVAGLVEAAQFYRKRCRQEDEGHNEYFERIADLFHQRHGYLAPGKDDPMSAHIPYEQKRAEWDAMCDEPRQQILAALAALEQEQGK